MTIHEADSQWDLFISYASEDRNEVAEPLAKVLSNCGLKVWYDQTALKLGDSLRRKIDEGLARCRYGAVILSPSFFLKYYPNRELDGLAQREIGGQTVILPVWHKVTDAEVRAYSPPLADRIAGRWEDGLVAVAARILEVVRPDLLEEVRRELRELEKKIEPLPQLRTGHDLAHILDGAMGFIIGHDELRDHDELELISGFHQYVQDWTDIISELDAGERVKMEFDLLERVRGLHETGWMVFGKQGKRQIGDRETAEMWPVAIVILAREGTTQVIMGEGDKFFIQKGDVSTGEVAL